MGLFVTKPIDRIISESGSDNQLRRTLGPVSLISLGIGAVIGAGIFTLTGVAAAQNAGPALVILVCVRSDRLRVRRSLLQRVLDHDPGGR